MRPMSTSTRLGSAPSHGLRSTRCAGAAARTGSTRSPARSRPPPRWRSTTAPSSRCPGSRSSSSARRPPLRRTLLLTAAPRSRVLAVYAYLPLRSAAVTAARARPDAGPRRAAGPAVLGRRPSRDLGRVRAARHRQRLLAAPSGRRACSRRSRSTASSTISSRWPRTIWAACCPGSRCSAVCCCGGACRWCWPAACCSDCCRAVRGRLSGRVGGDALLLARRISRWPRRPGTAWRSSTPECAACSATRCSRWSLSRWAALVAGDLAGSKTLFAQPAQRDGRAWIDRVVSLTPRARSSSRPGTTRRRWLTAPTCCTRSATASCSPPARTNTSSAIATGSAAPARRRLRRSRNVPRLSRSRTRRRVAAPVCASLARRARCAARGAFAFVVAALLAHGRNSPYDGYVLLAQAFAARAGRDRVARRVDRRAAVGGRYYSSRARFRRCCCCRGSRCSAARTKPCSRVLLCGVAVGACWRTCEQLGVGRATNAWICAFLFAGTQLAWCAMLGDVWFIAHVASVACTFLALAELTGKRRGWLIAAGAGGRGVFTLFARAGDPGVRLARAA